MVRGHIPCLKDVKLPADVTVMPRSGDMAQELAPAVSRFVEFIRSSAGAAVIVANGAVPVK